MPNPPVGEGVLDNGGLGDGKKAGKRPEGRPTRKSSALGQDGEKAEGLPLFT